MTRKKSFSLMDRSRQEQTSCEFFGQPIPWIKAFKMDLRVVTEHLYQEFTRASSHVPGACWRWQSWVCWQRRCRLVWTFPEAPAVLWSCSQPMSQRESCWDSHGLSPLSKQRKEQILSLGKVTPSTELRAVSGSHHPTLMAQKCWKPP